MARTPRVQPGVEIPDIMLSDALVMLNRPIEDAYAALGRQLWMLEIPVVSATGTGWRIGLRMFLRMKKTDFRAKARKFLDAHWKKIRKEVCKWWKKNKDKTGQELIRGVMTAVAAALPSPWDRLTTVLPIIAVIVIKSGLGRICGKMTTKPP